MLRSSTPSPHRARRSGPIIAAAAIAGLALAGCTPDTEPAEPDAPAASASATPSPGDAAEQTPAASPTPSPTPTPTSVPATVDCAAVLPSQALYDFNPNVGVQSDYTPAEGTLPAEMVNEQNGGACGFVNLTSGEQIEFAVAHLLPGEAQRRKDALVVANDPVPIYAGDEGYFSLIDGVGQAQVFAGDYWIVGRSTAFYEPGDHAALVSSVVENVVALQP